MAVDTTEKIVEKEVNKINKSAEINEAYYVGLLWSNPSINYGDYVDTLSEDEFIHDVWAFYFEFGRKMYLDKIKTFDTITVKTKAKDYGILSEFEEFGGMAQIEDAVDIVKENAENIDYYYETIKRNYTLRQLYTLFGDKIFLKKNKYNYEIMNREQLTMYWNDQMNQIGVGGINRYEAENVYIDPKEFIRKLKEESAEMMPFYNGKLMNTVTQGVARGHVMMLGGFGGSGKSSIATEKFLMSCIANKEKTIIIMNEEDAQALRQKLVLTILWNELKDGFDRTHMTNGQLDARDEECIHKAFARMHELLEGEEATLKVIFMEKYIMSDVEKIVRFWANRGYINLLVDTHKVSDDSKYDQRWQIFVEDMKTIYRLTRKDAGGLNLRTVVTFQLSDSAVSQRYLDFQAIGEGRASKNEASVVMMFRNAWSDEVEGAKKPLQCYKLVKKKDGSGKYTKEFFTMDRGDDNSRTFYLVFFPKNRFGKSNDTGQPVMVMEAHFHKNTFSEIGWTVVSNEKGGR